MVGKIKKKNCFSFIPKKNRFHCIETCHLGHIKKRRSIKLFSELTNGGLKIVFRHKTISTNTFYLIFDADWRPTTMLIDNDEPLSRMDEKKIFQIHCLFQVLRSAMKSHNFILLVLVYSLFLHFLVKIQILIIIQNQTLLLCNLTFSTFTFSFFCNKKPWNLFLVKNSKIYRTRAKRLSIAALTLHHRYSATDWFSGNILMHDEWKIRDNGRIRHFGWCWCACVCVCASIFLIK